MQPIIRYYKNGKKHKEECFLDDKYHRIDGAAYTNRYKNGNKRLEEWKINGILHRIDGPAYIEWYGNGNKKSEEWYLYDKLQYVLKYKKYSFQI
jgi:antitoxin component YwqK of YwqJK toxin-antitoxin module